MDGTSITSSPAALPPSEIVGCPNCAEPWAPCPPVTAARFDDKSLRRCCRCATLFVLPPDGPAVPVLHCTDCGLPFAAGPEDPGCPGCRANGVGAAPFDDEHLRRAGEFELRAALSSAWSFVGSPTSATYLGRVARDAAKAVGGEPACARVAIFDEPTLCTLVLPSGWLLVSTGTLNSLDDEAELLFLLAHEWTHVTAGHAARSLPSFAVPALARAERDPDTAVEIWSETAQDMIALGHGVEAEQLADARGLDAVLSLGYDPRSVVRYLGRLAKRHRHGDAELLAVSLAHPAPAERRKSVERMIAARMVGPETRRVNREVFRRAVGGPALASLLPVDGLAAGPDDRRAGLVRGSWKSALLASALGIVLLALLFLLVGVLLSS